MMVCNCFIFYTYKLKPNDIPYNFLAEEIYLKKYILSKNLNLKKEYFGGFGGYSLFSQQMALYFYVISEHKTIVGAKS